MSENQEGTQLIVADLETVEGTPIEVYGAKAVVYEVAKRLMNLHPAAADVGSGGMMAVAQLAVLVGANPLPSTNEIHVWMNKGRPQVDLGINFFRRRGRELGGYLWGLKPRLMRDEERRAYEVPEDHVAAISQAARKTDVLPLLAAGVPMGDVWDMCGEYGIHSVPRNGTRAKAGKPLSWTALKGAEKDVLKKLFPNLEQDGGERHAWERDLEIVSALPALNVDDAPEDVLERNGALLRAPEDFEGFGDERKAEPVAVVDWDTYDVAGSSRCDHFTPVDVEPCPEPEAAKANGNGHNYQTKAERATAMLTAVNDRTGGYYNAVPHLLNALRLELGEEWDWPELDEETEWAQAYNAALAHSKKDGG